MQRLDGQALLKRLPAVRGRLEPDAELAPLTWFRAGGKAEVLFAPADEADLAQFLAATPVRDPGHCDRGRFQSSGPRWRRSRRGHPARQGVLACRGRGPSPHPRGCGGARRPGCPRGARSWYLRVNLSERYTGHHRRRVADEWRGLWRGNQGRLGGGQSRRQEWWSSRAYQCRYALQLPSLRGTGRSDLHRGVAAGPSRRYGRDFRRHGCDHPEPRSPHSRSRAAPAARPSRIRRG